MLKAFSSVLEKANKSTTPSSEKDINLIMIRDGSLPAVIVVNGFLSGGKDDISDWLELIDIIHPMNKVIHVQWNAGSITELIQDNGLLPKVTELNKNNSLFKNLGFATLKAVNKLSGHWKKAFQQTENVGHQLASILNQDDTLNDCIIMGHSLGGRIVCNTLDSLKPNRISQCYLFAAAADSNKTMWQGLIDKHSKTKFVNCTSQNDTVLKVGYKLGTAGGSALGVNLLPQSPLHHIQNIDMTEIVSSHTEFKNKVVGGYLIRQLLK